MAKVKSIIGRLNPYMIKKGFGYLFKYGPKELYLKVNDKCKPYDMDYEAYRIKVLPTKEELRNQRKHTFSYEPRISVIVPCYNTRVDYFTQMLDSVFSQTYENYQLCIAIYADEEHEETKDKLLLYANAHDEISYVILDKNQGIAGNTNEALKLADGDFIALLDHDDFYEPDLFYEVVKVINENMDADVIYTDEDKVDETSTIYSEPYFKSDFNIDLLRGNNYICHEFMVRKTIVDNIGGFNSEFDGAQDYDFIFRCIEEARGIYHLPKVLYHWRVHSESTAMDPTAKMYAFDAGKHAIEAHLDRMNLCGKVEHLEDRLGFYSVKYVNKDKPLVSIIIPNRNQMKILKRCIDSILEKSTYDNFEILIIENNSTEKSIFVYYKKIQEDNRVKVIVWDKEFNYSAINNFGVSKASGEYILFLNNDVKVVAKDWLVDMVGIMSREEVGIIGAKLLYKDNTIQHGGVIIGLGGVAGHAFTGLSKGANGYFTKLLLKHNVSAVTAACMMVNRQVFKEVNGFDEKLKVAFNDVDFCLKVREKGYLIVFDPEVLLYHYESVSRGYENSPEKIKRFNKEIAYMKEKWSDILENGDPFYNKNLSLEDNGYHIRRIL